MLDLFKEYKAKDLKSVGIPEPMTCISAAGHSDDQVRRILKYIYSNQNIYSVKDELNEQNVFLMYAQAHVLKM